MLLSKSVKPISYVKAHASELVNSLDEGASPLVITQNGEAKAVLQSVRDYEQMQESLAMLKMIAMSEKSVKEGNFKSISKTFNEIRKETRRMKKDRFPCEKK